MLSALRPETYISALCAPVQATLSTAHSCLSHSVWTDIYRNIPYISSVEDYISNFYYPGSAFYPASLLDAVPERGVPILAAIRSTYGDVIHNINDVAFCPSLVTKVGTNTDLLLSRVASGSTDVLVPSLHYLIHFASIFTLISLVVTLAKALYALFYPRHRTFIVDFSVFTDFSPQWRVDPDHWFKYSEEHLGVPKEAAEFAAKIFSRSGIGRTTHLSPTLLCPPPQIDMAAARKEGMIVMTGAIDALLARTGMAARDIDILVVNCSLFNPTPSHTAMLVHHYGLPSHTITYSIAGMGCSASHIALDCARGALAVHPRRDAVAVVVSYENLTQNFYSGDQREMIVANALFRMGASAVMVSKQERVRGLRARYELDALVRHHLGADPVGYSCIYQDTDITYAAGADGRPLRQPATHGAFEKPPIQGLGVRLSKSVPVIAARGLTACIGDIALSCLSWTALAEYAARFLVFRARLAMGRVDKSAAPVPAFHRELDHFCIHAGGKAVVAGISNTLSLSEAQAAASVRTLYKYGNTSSSSVWYSLYECERGQHVPGDPRSGCDSWEEEDAHAAAAGYKRGSRYSEMDAVDVAGAIGKRDIYLGMASELSLQAVARAPCEAFRRFIREERREGVRRGERVWGVFFGSGMKIGSTVLRRL